jgi:hypothetical protein
MANLFAVAGPDSKYAVSGANAAGFWAGLWPGLIRADLRPRAPGPAWKPSPGCPTLPR